MVFDMVCISTPYLGFVSNHSILITKKTIGHNFDRILAFQILEFHTHRQDFNQNLKDFKQTYGRCSATRNGILMDIA